MTYQKTKGTLLAEKTKDSWVDNRCGVQGLFIFKHLEAQLENVREDNNLTPWSVFKELQFSESSPT